MNPRLRSTLGLLAVVLVIGGASEAWRAYSDRRLGARIASLASPGDIEMLASDTCPYCVKAREWFTANGAPFKECSIERDTACAARFQALMSPATPLILVRGQRQVGFDATRVAEALTGG